MEERWTICQSYRMYLFDLEMQLLDGLFFQSFDFHLSMIPRVEIFQFYVVLQEFLQNIGLTPS